MPNLICFLPSMDIPDIFHAGTLDWTYGDSEGGTLETVRARVYSKPNPATPPPTPPPTPPEPADDPLCIELPADMNGSWEFRDLIGVGEGDNKLGLWGKFTNSTLWHRLIVPFKGQIEAVMYAAPAPGGAFLGAPDPGEVPTTSEGLALPSFDVRVNRRRINSLGEIGTLLMAKGLQADRFELTYNAALSTASKLVWTKMVNTTPTEDPASTSLWMLEIRIPVIVTDGTFPANLFLFQFSDVTTGGAWKSLAFDPTVETRFLPVGTMRDVMMVQLH